MKYVLGFIPHDRLDALVDTLEETHVHGLTDSHRRGNGQELQPREPEHHDHPGVDLVRKLRVEVVCRDEELPALRDSFSRLRQPGRHGAGKLFVLDVLDAMRLQTAERGEAALGAPAGASGSGGERGS